MGNTISVCHSIFLNEDFFLQSLMLEVRLTANLPAVSMTGIQDLQEDLCWMCYPIPLVCLCASRDVREGTLTQAFPLLTEKENIWVVLSQTRRLHKNLWLHLRKKHLKCKYILAVLEHYIVFEVIPKWDPHVWSCETACDWVCVSVTWANLASLPCCYCEEWSCWWVLQWRIFFYEWVINFNIFQA